MASMWKNLCKKLKKIKIRKSSIWLVVITMSIAIIGWIFFLIFFGRVSPIIKDTTSKNFKLYNYSLVTLPFWVYSFFAPVLYPIIGMYILNGNWILGVFAQIATGMLAFLLGAVLNMSAAIVHVIRNLDHNTATKNICIVGMVGVVASLLNLVLILIVMLVYEKWSNRKKIKKIVKNTFPRDSFDNSDEETELDMGYYANMQQAPIYDTVEGVQEEIKHPRSKNKQRSHRS